MISLHPTASPTGTLRVGARGSELSLAQTGWVRERLRDAHPGLKLEIVVIHTHGDRDQHTPLAELGPPGGFVKDIERALLGGSIDLAVHSLKDMPTQPVPGLEVAAIPRRAPAGDVMLTREPVDLKRLPAGFVVGTSSPRRSHQMMRWAGEGAGGVQIRAVPVRGNVPTRIRHLMEGQFDGLILAAAGLERLGIAHAHRVELPLEDFLPAPGQGALGVQTRAGSEVSGVVRAIDDRATRIAVTAEREFLRATGGGCHAALGGLATLRGEELTLRGELFVDGRSRRARITGPSTDAELLGQKLAQMLGPAWTSTAERTR
jgi:hydroxymethylbilane synthase